MGWQPRFQSTFHGKEKRSALRQGTNKSAILHHNGARIPVVLENLSGKGTKVRMCASAAGRALDGALTLEIPGLLTLPLRLHWRKGGNLGVQFDLPAPRLAMLEPQIKRMLQRTAR